jgi:hypothetical protein
MITDMTEENYKLVNEKAVVLLKAILEDIEKHWGEDEYEINMVAHAYAMMIAVSILGYYPERIAKEAEGAAEIVRKMVSEDEEGETNDE